MRYRGEVLTMAAKSSVCRIVTVTILIGTTACDGGPARNTEAPAKRDAAAAPDSSASAAASARSPAANDEPAVIEDDVEDSVGRGTVQFSVALPPGLRKVSFSPMNATYRKSQDDVRGPSIIIVTPRPDEETFKEAIASAKRAQRIILKEEKLVNGWLLATQDDDDKLILVKRYIEGRPAPLACFAMSRGIQAMANKDAELAVLERACRSVTHKTPARNPSQSK